MRSYLKGLNPKRDYQLISLYSFSVESFIKFMRIREIMNNQIIISIWATTHLPLPKPTLTLSCCQLTVVELGEG